MPASPRTTPRYDPALLRDLAGARSFDRGAKYAAAGRVTGLRRDGDRVTADVEGADLYHGRLRGRDDALRAHRDCPAAGPAG